MRRLLFANSTAKLKDKITQWASVLVFRHINYCMHRVNMLRHFGVKPVLVFDGGPLPMKTDQEVKRAR